MKGYISPQFTGWCGKCLHFEQASAKDKRDMGRTLKDMGWRFTKEDGWVCNRCVNFNQVLTDKNNEPT